MDQVYLSEISDSERYKYESPVSQQCLEVASWDTWEPVRSAAMELMPHLYGIWPTLARNSAYTIKESYPRRGGSRFTIRSIVNLDCPALPRIFVPQYITAVGYRRMWRLTRPKTDSFSWIYYIITRLHLVRPIFIVIFILRKTTRIRSIKN